MILEPIQNFVRAPFCIEEQDGAGMGAGEMLATIKKMEQRSIDYYTTAAVKIKALPEVAVALKLLAKNTLLA